MGDEKEFHDVGHIFQLENASLYCTLLFVYRGTYAVSFPTNNITAKGFILQRLFSFNHFLSGSYKFKPIMKLYQHCNQLNFNSGLSSDYYLKNRGHDRSIWNSTIGN